MWARPDMQQFARRDVGRCRHIHIQTVPQDKLHISAIYFPRFLADRTNSRAIGTVLGPSVVCCLYGMYCG